MRNEELGMENAAAKCHYATVTNSNSSFLIPNLRLSNRHVVPGNGHAQQPGELGVVLLGHVGREPHVHR